MLGKGVDALKNWGCDQQPGLFIFQNNYWTNF